MTADEAQQIRDRLAALIRRWRDDAAKISETGIIAIAHGEAKAGTDLQAKAAIWQGAADELARTLDEVTP